MPDPAPATTKSGPLSCKTASFCLSLRVLSNAEIGKGLVGYTIYLDGLVVARRKFGEGESLCGVSFMGTKIDKLRYYSYSTTQKNNLKSYGSSSS